MAERALGEYVLGTSSSARRLLIRALIKSVPTAARAIASFLARPDNLNEFLQCAQGALEFLLAPEYPRLCVLQPTLGEAVDSLLFDRNNAVTAVADATLAESPGRVARSVPKLGARWPGLAQALEERLLDSAVERDVAHRAGAIQATELPTVLRFAFERGDDFGQLIETQIREYHKTPIVAELARNAGLVNHYSRAGSVSPLLPELANEAARHHPSSVERHGDRYESPRAHNERRRLELLANPERALLTSWPFTIQVIDNPATPATAATTLLDVMGDPSNSEIVVALALVLSPEHLGQVLIWTQQHIPALYQDLLEHISGSAGLERLAELCVDSTFDHIAGLLSLLDDIAPSTALALEQQLTNSPWLSQLVFAGYGSHSSGWAALLERTGLAKAVLDRIDERQWEQRWRSVAPEQPHWLRRLSIQLHDHGRPDLQRAPAEHVVLTSRREDWRSSSFGLPQLDSVLRHSRALGDQAAIAFIHRVLGADWLDTQFREQPAGSVASFINAAWYWRGETVVEELMTRGFRRRVTVEERGAWTMRAPDDSRGTLMLAGAASLVGLRSHDFIVARGWWRRGRSLVEQWGMVDEAAMYPFRGLWSGGHQ